MPTSPRETEEALLAKLRAGDEATFAALVDGLHARLLAFAGTFTASPALAEDIVQETWLGVIKGLRGFEGRSSLRTWIFNILARRARTMAGREARRHEVPAGAEEGGPDPAAPAWEPGKGRIGLWEGRPAPWGLEDPAAVFQTREAMRVVQAAFSGLPEKQRQVVLLRDVEDLGAIEICNVLEISETNQRVLLHRGRARIRLALEHYVRGEPRAAQRPRTALPGAAVVRSQGSAQRKETAS